MAEPSVSPLGDPPQGWMWCFPWLSSESQSRDESRHMAHEQGAKRLCQACLLRPWGQVEDEAICYLGSLCPWASRCLLIPQWKRAHTEKKFSQIYFYLPWKQISAANHSQSSGTGNRQMYIFWPRPITATELPQGQVRPCIHTLVLTGWLCQAQGL